MRIAHQKTNTGPWAEAYLAGLDKLLRSSGSEELDVECGSFALEDDGDHHTREGYRGYAHALARAAQPRGRVAVYADSTVDFHNYVECGGCVAYTGWASVVLTDALLMHGASDVHIDARCGSGFVAMAATGEHVYARLSRDLRAGPAPDLVLFVSGWNDARSGRCCLMTAARCIELCRRYATLTPRSGTPSAAA